jgi:uncharacterized protein YjiS (DUF1127 family)
MPAVTSLSILSAARLSRAIGALGGRLALPLHRIGRLFRNRRDVELLARLDDHMLADIGLTRSDVRDAYSQSLWRDPTDVLARRANERRASRRRFPRSAHQEHGGAVNHPPLDHAA